MGNANIGESTGDYISFDPGVSTGWATFDSKGELTARGILRGLDELMDFLQNMKPHKTVICEDYRVFGKKANAHIGSRLETSQVIGMIKVYVARWKAELVMQPSSILPIAGLWSGEALPKNHDKSHDIAAYNHGVYYLQRQGIREPRIIKEARKND